MADFKCHLKKNKLLVLFTLCAFLSMTWFSSCSKPANQEKTEVAEKADNPSVEPEDYHETAGQESPGSSKEDEPCDCPESPDEIRPFTQEDWNQLSNELDLYFQSLEDSVKEIPHDTFDSQAVVDHVGEDAEALFRWVRDNTRLVPYEGVLRGPVGVLMDRMGNSLDRALLLHELLHLAGLEVRIAHGHLSGRKLNEILEKNRTIQQEKRSSAREPSSQELDNLIEEYSNRHKINPERLKKHVSRIRRESENFSKELVERVTVQTGFITNAIKRYQKKAETKPINARTDELDDHWWVQLKKDDTWIDLDPISKEMAFGSSINHTENVCQPNEIDESLFHSINLQVIIEQWKDGVTEEKMVLEHRLIPAELYGQRIGFKHIPMNWPEDLDLIGNKDPIKSLKSAVLKEKEWQPVLIVGDERIAQSSFLASGEINDTPGKKGRPSGVQGVAGGILGALSGEKDEKEAKKASFLTAEWIDYTVHTPGRPDRTIRRKTFDMIGPAARKNTEISQPNIKEIERLKRGLLLLSETEILIQSCRLSPEFVVHLMAEIFLSNHEILKEILQAVDSSEQVKNVLNKFQDLTPLPGPEYVLSEARLSWSELNNKIYLGQPNILNYARRPVLDQNEQIVVKSGFDIVSHELCLDPILEQDHFQANIYQGVVDTNVEALIMKSIGGKTENTAEIFACSKAQKINWLTLIDTSSSGWRELDTTEDIRAHIEKDLNEGYIVIAPQKEILLEGQGVFGWWRVDPVSGSTLGIGSEGGQALVEYAMKAAHIVSIITCLIELAHEKDYKSIICRMLFCVAITGLAYFTHLAWHKLSWLVSLYKGQDWWTAIIVQEWRILFGVSADLGMIAEVLSQYCSGH